MGVPFYLLGVRNRPAHPPPEMREFGMQAAARYGEEAVAAWKAGGQTGLGSYFERVRARANIELYLFTGEESLLPDEQPPPPLARKVAAMAIAGVEDVRALPPGERWLGRRLDFLPSEAPEDSFTIVLRLPDPPHPPPPPPMRGGPWDNILLYSLAGGLVCYFLARSLTAPVRKLREATKALAHGDFSVRVGGKLGGEGSEVADLGRDFDVMAERIESLLAAQKQLLRDISHELRSPLARLNVALELARQRAGEEAGQPLARIERESGRLNELIGELLVLTRMESGAQKIESEGFSLNDLLQMVVDDARYEARTRNRDVCYEARAAVFIQGSRELMRRALENVVRNAVQYTAERSAVEIVLTQEVSTSLVVITVTDHGPGVPEESLCHLFEPFYRVAEARDRQSGGSGIGLAIAERAVRLHGGALTAANGPAGGLVVTMTLPRPGEDGGGSRSWLTQPASAVGGGLSFDIQ